MAAFLAHPAARLIIALDVPSVDAARRAVDSLAEHEFGDQITLKIGLQLLYRPGCLAWLKQISEKRHLFIDAKLFDIPNTVAKATETIIGELNPALLTVSGVTPAKAARQVADAQAAKTRVLAVTVLTSEATTDETAGRVAEIGARAIAAGAHGLIASAQDLQTPELKPLLARNNGLAPREHPVLLVTPGIRFPDDARDDQKRATTPQDAIKAGASMLVVGRPIMNTLADKAVTAARLKTIVGVLKTIRSSSH